MLSRWSLAASFLFCESLGAMRRSTWCASLCIVSQLSAFDFWSLSINSLLGEVNAIDLKPTKELLAAAQALRNPESTRSPSQATFATICSELLNPSGVTKFGSNSRCAFAGVASALSSLWTRLSALADRVKSFEVHNSTLQNYKVPVNDQRVRPITLLLLVSDAESACP